MVRRKIPITKITDESSLRVAYSKRKDGIIKKSYEMSVLAGAKVAFISFSEAYRLTFFSGFDRIEDVIEHFVRSPKFLEAYTPSQQEQALRILSLIRSQNGTNPSYPTEAMALRLEEERKKAELREAMDALKTFQVEEGEIRLIDSISKLERHESVLMDALQHFSCRKMHLFQNFNSLNGPSTSQNSLVQSRLWLEGTSRLVQNQLLESQKRQLSYLLNEQNNLVQSRSLEGPSQIQICLPQTQEWQLPEPLNTQVSNVVNKQTHVHPSGPSTSIPVQENRSHQGQYNSEVQSLPFPSLQYLQNNILSQPPEQHLLPQNAWNSNPPAPQASASYTSQEPTSSAGTSMLPSMEAINEEVDYSYMFADSDSFSDYLDL